MNSLKPPSTPRAYLAAEEEVEGDAELEDTELEEPELEDAELPELEDAEPDDAESEAFAAGSLERPPCSLPRPLPLPARESVR